MQSFAGFNTAAASGGISWGIVPGHFFFPDLPSCTGITWVWVTPWCHGHRCHRYGCGVTNLNPGHGHHGVTGFCGVVFLLCFCYYFYVKPFFSFFFSNFFFAKLIMSYCDVTMWCDPMLSCRKMTKMLVIPCFWHIMVFGQNPWVLPYLRVWCLKQVQCDRSRVWCVTFYLRCDPCYALLALQGSSSPPGSPQETCSRKSSTSSQVLLRDCSATSVAPKGGEVTLVADQSLSWEATNESISQVGKSHCSV